MPLPLWALMENKALWAHSILTQCMDVLTCAKPHASEIQTLSAKKLLVKGGKKLWKVLFMKMAPKAKKEAPALPKAKTKVKVKAWKAKKAMLNGVHGYKKRSECHTPSVGPRHWGSEGSSNVLRRVPPGETSLTTVPSSSLWTLSQPWRW